MDKYQNPTTNVLLDMASLVDPRFKTQCVDRDMKERREASAASELKSILTLQAGQQKKVNC